MTLRTILIITADGERHALEYETELEGADDAALQAEVLAALVTKPTYELTCRADGTTALFLTEVASVQFMR